MAEPERRRRRVRPPSGANNVPEEPAAPVPGPPPSAPVPAPPPSAPATSAPATSAPAPSAPVPTAPIPAAPIPAAPVPVAPASKGFNRPVKRPVPAGGGNPEDREAERGLRGLVGSGSSQVSVGAALRARDASRPTDADLDAADRDLQIVRRNWLPREDLPRR